MSEFLAIGFGSNLGSRDQSIERVKLAANSIFEVLDCEFEMSPLCVSEAVGPTLDQPDFVNAVAVSRTLPPLPAHALMAVILDLEGYLGRTRDSEVEKGPRVIDIDLLLFGDEQISIEGPPDLCLPHPRIHERRFVLEPLSRIVGADFVFRDRSLAAWLSDATVAAQRLEWI